MSELLGTDIATGLQQVVKHWIPRVVGQMNDQYIEVARLLGEAVELDPGQFYVVPRGVQLHSA